MTEDNDIVLQQAVRLMSPFIFVFGIYVTFHGHLTPGGGFSGGTIIAAGLILNSIAHKKFNGIVSIRPLLTIICFSLLLYGTIKALGTFFPEFIHGVVPLGVPGDLLSGGTILPLNLAVGAIVSCIMYIFFSLIGEGL